MIERLDQLDREVKRITPLWPAQGYLFEMWRYVLAYRRAELSADRAPPPPTIDCDAIPYIPEACREFGLRFDAQSHVLDLGCLGGYGMFDLAQRCEAAGETVPRMTGLDIAPESVEIGRQLASIWKGGNAIDFVTASADSIPIGDGACSLVVARLLLPYVRIQDVLHAIAGVLRAGGMALFQIHAGRYYARCAARHVLHPKRCVYYLRPLLAGGFYALTGHQARHRWFQETALSPATLIGMCRKLGLTCVWQGGFALKPLVLLRKR